MMRILRWITVLITLVVIMGAGALAYSFAQTRPLTLIVYMTKPQTPAVVQWAAWHSFFVFHPTRGEVRRLNEQAGARYAAIFDNREHAETILDHLLEHGANIDSVDEASGLTALQGAALQGDEKAVNLLLSGNAKPNAVGRPNSEGNPSLTPLEIAKKARDKEGGSNSGNYDDIIAALRKALNE